MRYRRLQLYRLALHPRLLLEGYNVRTTVRSTEREHAIRKIVTPKEISDAAARLSFAVADLGKDQGWDEAVRGCKYVLHVASPFPSSEPSDENILIQPAVNGTLRVLKACLKEHVQRIILTSSFAAMGYGHKSSDTVMNEGTWSVTDTGKLGAYAKSKTLADRAAWDFIDKHPELELVTMNPAVVFGPILGHESGAAIGTSLAIIKRMMTGGIPAAPIISFGCVDARDVAILHTLALDLPEAKGKRFLVVAGKGEFITGHDIGAELGHPIRVMPNWLARFLGLFLDDLRV